MEILFTGYKHKQLFESDGKRWTLKLPSNYFLPVTRTRMATYPGNLFAHFCATFLQTCSRVELLHSFYDKVTINSHYVQRTPSFPYLFYFANCFRGAKCIWSAYLLGFLFSFKFKEEEEPFFSTEMSVILERKG